MISLLRQLLIGCRRAGICRRAARRLATFLGQWVQPGATTAAHDHCEHSFLSRHKWDFQRGGDC